MKAKGCLFACLLVLASAARAEEPSTGSTADFSTPLLRGNTSLQHWDNLLVEKDQLDHQHFPPLKLGRTGFNVGGPLVNTFRRRSYPPDRTFAQKVLDLPIINLFVPGPMPNPPESGGRYFAWRGSRTGSAKAASLDLDNVNHEPEVPLISVGK